jgi:hypothetical protein
LGIADKKIFAKILYGMDLQCQRFSKDCMICSNREDVDDSYLDWSQLIRSIELQTVCFTLPAQFNSKEPGTDNTAGDDLSPNGGGGGRGRNGKRKRDDEDRRVRNEAQFEQFKLQANENYKIFTGRDNAIRLAPISTTSARCPTSGIFMGTASPIARTKTVTYLILNTLINRRLPLEAG